MKKKFNSLKAVVALTAMALLPCGAMAQDGLLMSKDAPTVTEDFNSMWDASASEALLTMPRGWKVERQLSNPNQVGAYSAASASVMYSGGVSLASNAKNGTWNFGSSSDPSDRAVGGLSTTVADGTRCVSVMTKVHNSADEKIGALTLSYDIEKYRDGDNAAGFCVQVYYSYDGSSWASAGSKFYTYFSPDAATAGAAVVPISTTQVKEQELVVNVAAGADIYLAWNISVASGTSPNKAMGLAVDNIKATATFGDVKGDDRPPFVSSGIYLRGEINSWGAPTAWEFSDEGNGVYRLYDKIVSGQFKVADSSWSSACNYGSNGDNMLMDEPYALVAGTSTNISCGANSYTCKEITLTINADGATLLFTSDDDATGLDKVYVIGDNNAWNYMNPDGALNLVEGSETSFAGQLSFTAGNDGLSHWLIYQKLGMAGAWGLEADATEAVPTGTLVKGAKGTVAVAPGTYDVTFDIATGSYTLVAKESTIQSLDVMPQNVVLVKQVPDEVKVLSLNNSLIYYNDQDAVFNDIAKAMGKKANWTKHTLLGQPLSTHWNEGEGLTSEGTPGAKMMVRSEAWSHIILQEQSSLPRTGVETFRANVKKWVEYIRANCPNPNAVIIVPVNWAYSGDWSNYTEYNRQLLANYRDVARELGVTLCPVAVAYQNVYNKEGASGTETWFLDDRHPTLKATYMAACMEYQLIYGEDASTITYVPAGVSASDAQSMRTYASQAMNGFVNYVDHTAGKVNYAVVARDQFGNEVAVPESTTVTVSGGGTLDDKFTFTSDGTKGTFTVNAVDGIFNSTATVVVTDPVVIDTKTEAVVIGEDNTVSQNFNTMATDGAATLPAGWRIDHPTTAPRTVGKFYEAQTETMYSGGTSLASNAKNGTWNFGATSDASDRAVGGISTSVAGGTRCVNVYVHMRNDGVLNLKDATLAYDIEKYRTGNNPAGFDVQLYYSLDGQQWKSAGEAFHTHYDADASTAGYADAPGVTTHVTGNLPGVVTHNSDYYLAWNISVASGDAANGAMALAIDNVEFAAVPGETYPGPYTVAGVAAIANGISWDPAATVNDMKSEDGLNYTLKVENCSLNAGTSYQWKVAADHAWTVCYGDPNASNVDGNAELKVNESGTYNITYHFNAATHALSADAELVGGPAPIYPGPYTVAGVAAIANGYTWDPTATVNDMKSEDGRNFTLVVNGCQLVAGTVYEYKVTVDHGWDTCYGDPNASNENGNAELTVNESGNYKVTFMFDAATHEVSAKAEKESETAINDITVSKGNGKTYNMMGQEVAPGTRGIVIRNGKKIYNP